MKQTDLHSVKYITSLLISVHYTESRLTFIQGNVVTRGHFTNETKSAACMQDALSDDPQKKITGCVIISQQTGTVGGNCFLKKCVVSEP